MLKLIKSTLQAARRMHWGLGVLETPLEDIVGGKNWRVRWIQNPYRDRWFADPFILDFNDDRIEVLVEEFCYSVNRGRIAHISVDRKNLRITYFKILLDLNTHLSFPLIFRDNGRVYIMPENFESGHQTIYEYEQESDSLINPCIIYSGKLTDAVIFESGGKKFVLSTEVPEHNGNKLKIFELKANQLSQVSFSIFQNNVARNAGGIFQINNKIYRPAQVCDNNYGEAVEIQEMDTSMLPLIKFSPIVRMKSTSWAFSEGLHTFNTWRGMTIIDVHGYRKPFIGKSVEFMASIVRRVR